MDYCLVYISTASSLLTEEELTNILTRSRQKNSALGITGILLYFNGNIIQVLEGQQDQVARVYERIKRDPRHNQLIELYKKVSSWTMRGSVRILPGLAYPVLASNWQGSSKKIIESRL